MRTLGTGRIKGDGAHPRPSGHVACRTYGHARLPAGGYGRRHVNGRHDRWTGSHGNIISVACFRPVCVRAGCAASSIDMAWPDKMKSKLGPLLVTLALVAGAGAGGAWIGARLLQPPTYTHDEFHDRLFSELQLSAEQQSLMDAVEARYAVESKMRRERLTAANRVLADILESENTYDAAVEAALENVHTTMFDLQKSTIRHLYEMRDILNAEQKAIFDGYVAETLREFSD